MVCQNLFDADWKSFSMAPQNSSHNWVFSSSPTEAADLLTSWFLLLQESPGSKWAERTSSVWWPPSQPVFTSRFFGCLHNGQLFLDTLETFNMTHSDSMSSDPPGCQNNSSGGRSWRCSQFTLDCVNWFGFTKWVQQPPPSPVPTYQQVVISWKLCTSFYQSVQDIQLHIWWKDYKQSLMFGLRCSGSRYTYGLITLNMVFFMNNLWPKVH